MNTKSKQTILIKCYNKTSKGFTLLEVMIVISIISILAGFLIPKFVGYENKAKTVKAISSAKQMYNAVMCAYDDKGSSLSTTDVETSISNLTGANVTGKVTISGNTVNIIYTSDNNDYTLSLDDSSGNYSVKYGTNTIFTQN